MADFGHPSARRDIQHLAFGDLQLRDKGLLEYVWPSVALFAAWWVAHQLFLQAWGAKNLGAADSKYGR